MAELLTGCASGGRSARRPPAPSPPRHPACLHRESTRLPELADDLPERVALFSLAWSPWPIVVGGKDFHRDRFQGESCHRGIPITSHPVVVRRDTSFRPLHRLGWSWSNGYHARSRHLGSCLGERCDLRGDPRPFARPASAGGESASRGRQSAKHSPTRTSHRQQRQATTDHLSRWLRVEMGAPASGKVAMAVVLSHPGKGTRDGRGAAPS